MAKSEQLTFKIGDWIVHRSYGVGQVKEIVTKEMAGSKDRYYRVETANAVFWLPLNNPGISRVRPVSTRSQMGKALTLMRKESQLMDVDHKDRERWINKKINDFSIRAKACLIRDLHGQLVRLRLNAREEGIYEQLKGEFLEELVLAYKMDRESAEEKMRAALDKSTEAEAELQA